jgi:4-amino-4-deoxy-L-arabinose transferase-like glycosyltransferase
MKDFFKKYIYSFLLVLVIAFSLFLRVNNLGGNPPALNQDEAVNGYDAYSIAYTMKDHHGNFMPLMLESYEDWASPALTYMTVPFVRILGLSEFSIRLPVAIFGSVTVLLMYVFLKQLTNNKKIALTAAFLLAIMPWHITLSRWAIPPSIVPFFLLLFLCSFMWAYRAKGLSWLYKYPLTGIAAGLLTYSYPTQKMFVPFIIGAIFLIFMLKHIRRFIAFALPYAAVISPMYLLTFLNPVKYNSRFDGVSILTMKGTNPIFEFVPRYLTYFTPIFNFGTGDGDTMHHVPGIGSSYEFLSIFFYLGIVACIYIIWTKKEFIINRKTAMLLIAWLVLFPIPAALTRDYAHVLRALHGLPLVIVFVCIGTKLIYDMLRDRWMKLSYSISFIVIAVFSIINFCGVYFGPYTDIAKEGYQYGIKDYSYYLANNENQFAYAVIDIKINNPYIYYLFYNKISPEVLSYNNYQDINATVDGKGGWTGVHKIGKYQFRTIEDNEVNETMSPIYEVKANNRTWYKIYQVRDTMFVKRNY